MIYFLLIIVLSVYVFADVSVANVSLNATSIYNLTADNLSCNFNLNSTAATSAVTWYINNIPQMILYMPFEANQTNALTDYSGYGNNATNFNNTRWNSTGGYDGNGAFVFNGSANYINLSNSARYQLTGTFSITGWIKVNNFNTAWQAVITKGDSSWRIHRFNVGNTIAFGTTGLSSEDVAGTKNINDGAWHFFAAAYNGTHKILYIDGVVDANATVTGTIGQNTYDVLIGENAQQRGRYWNGSIDDVRIYNYSLSLKQFDVIYYNYTNKIISEELSVYDTWMCKVIPFNSTFAGASVESNVITINAGGISDVILNSTDGYNYYLDNLTCNYNLFGGYVSSAVTWYKNNISMISLYMTFDGNSTNALKDYSGYNVSASRNGNLIWNSTAGLNNSGAFIFDMNATISTNYHEDDGIGSINYWFKLNSFNANGELCGQHDGDNRRFYAGIRNSTHGWFGIGTKTSVSEISKVISVNEWHMVTLSSDGINATFYIDGIVENVTSVTWGAGVSTGNFTISNVVFGTAYWQFNGTLDDIRVYNYSISAQQIKALYNNRTNLIVSDEINPDESWQCRVTPFSSVNSGNTQSSNIVIIQKCNIYINTVLFKNLECDIFRLVNPVYALLNNMTLKQNATTMPDNSAVIISNGGAYI